MLSEISGIWWVVGLSSPLAVLILILLRPRRAIAGQALVTLEGVVAGPGAPGARVHPRPRSRESSFLLEARSRVVPVVARDAVIVSSLLAGHRGELQVGDRIAVQGIWRSVPRSENLYRELGCEQAIDALCLVRGSRAPTILRGVALAGCLTSLGLLALLLLLHLGETLEVQIPELVLAPSRALLRGRLECPVGTVARIASRRDPRAPGWIRWCELPGGKPHGPWLQHDLLGEIVSRGERHLGLRHGRWIRRSGQDPFLTVCDYDRDERHGYYLEVGYGYREEGQHQRGFKHGCWTRWEADPRSGRQGLLWSRCFERGVPEGLWIEASRQGHYRRGNRHGSWTIEGEAPPEILASYYDRELTAHVSYRDGAREGPAVWLDHQRVVARGSYRRGKLDGRWVRIGDSRRDDGVLEECSYRDGLRHGQARVYAPDGTVAAEGEYSDGQRAGRWKIWSLGQLLTGDYARGMRTRFWTRDRISRQGTRQRLQRIEEGSYRDGLRHGLWRRLDADRGWVQHTYAAGRRVTGRAGDQQLRLAAHLLLFPSPALALPTVSLEDRR
jgi:antitoxin component YwqK of YwqJK toxin-antitoxin module